MESGLRELIELAQRAQRSDAPHRELAALLELLRATDPRAIHADAVERLLATTPALADRQAWAAEMQLGAEGFDNTTAARDYGDVQACLVAAGRQLARACEILLSTR
jgi:hypothetical protein